VTASKTETALAGTCCTAGTPPRRAGGPAQVVLISPYEIGRQPFALAHAAAWLRRAGLSVDCLDLAVERLDPARLSGARLVAVHLAMHTATRLAAAALPLIREAAPGAHLCAFGLYAPVNERYLRGLGFESVLGGECEPDLTELAREIVAGGGDGAAGSRVAAHVRLERVPFLLPARDTLPPLERYARLLLPGGGERTVGFAETTRGCKHLCRHCPVVPVYRGRFWAIPVETVLADIAQQVEAGAEHISFGDPDFLNGPTHALRVVRALHERFPHLSWDCTVKIEHLLRHRDLLPELRKRGCLFVISAVEAVDDAILARLDKGHTAADLERAVTLMRAAGLALAPTFVPFTPWTTLEGYVLLLETLVRLRLVEAVAPVQLAIRLLVPAGSRLLELEALHPHLGPFDPALLGHPWRHPDPRVDALQRRVQAWAAEAERRGLPRREAFAGVWRLAHEALGRAAPALPEDLGEPVPRLSEPWYCCAEPTEDQLTKL